MMWIIRFIALFTLVALDILAMRMLKHRNQEDHLVENRLFNIIYVITYHCICYLIVLLPPNSGWGMRPPWMLYTSVRIGYPLIGLFLVCVIGLFLVCAGIFLAFGAFKQRKTIGIQNVEGGLLTSGLYRYFRHPINTGILWVMLGLATALRNPDSLLIFPLVFALAVIGTISEEKNDMCVRFRDEYHAYRKSTRMFGPIWIWAVLILTLSTLAGTGIITV